ncbi:MAG: glycoside hydrolase family 88 protein [Spirochaetales bacterium]|nr:glycoside hydrolase family 88 protein [Spirochaetales bacterium]
MKIIPFKNYLQKMVLVLLGLWCLVAQAQEEPATDVTTPLHLMKPEYPVPYGIPQENDVKEVLDRVYNYLNEVTPARVVDCKTGYEIQDFNQITRDAGLQQGDFRIVSYEWGVTYAGMLLAGVVTGDKRYTGYTETRLKLLADLTAFYRNNPELNVGRSPVRSVMDPRALDDAGAMCAAMIKAERMKKDGSMRPMIENFIDYIHTKEFRLEDGTLARNRPHLNTLWLDDLFMSVPALAQMGKLTGEVKYFDDAVKQVLQFSQRMFNKEKGLYMHGWVQGMEVHPQFHWGRANGWAVMTLVELLEVLPESHPGYADVLSQLQAHVAGLAARQNGTGFWHQLLDRPDSYLETSATAIYTYSIARAINRGYIDKQAYSAMVLLAWNAVSTKVNESGQVLGTCVGTGMAFDPAFYYYRPVNPYAAHGYGPVLLAGAEVISLLKNSFPKMNDSAVMFYPEEIKTNEPIFSVDE